MSKAWDHVPGLFLLAEAEGYSANFAGEPYDMQHEQNGLLVAPNFAAWQDFYQGVKPTIDILLQRKL
jgi:fructose-1,6-bisphosphatase/inositol monophosphatase family enzyme